MRNEDTLPMRRVRPAKTFLRGSGPRRRMHVNTDSRQHSTSTVARIALRELKAKPRRQRDDTAGKPTCNRAEVWVVNIARDLIRVQIQIVEQVEGINS